MFSLYFCYCPFNSGSYNQDTFETAWNDLLMSEAFVYVLYESCVKYVSVSSVLTNCLFRNVYVNSFYVYFELWCSFKKKSKMGIGKQ